MIKNIQYLPVLVLFTAFLPGATAAEKKQTKRADALAVLWNEPADISSRDLFYGSGGVENQPKAPFTFEKEDLEGTNPKFVVRDANNVKWKVKMGEETRPETAASRFVWAAGYFTDDDYFLAAIKVDRMPSHLKRGQSEVAADGTIANVRLKRGPKGAEKQGEWKWSESPFTGSRELNGLRVMMALINNWDLKDANNAIYEIRPKNADPQRIFLISDLGATFGTTGRSVTRAGGKGNLSAYTDSKFITRVNDGFVNFGTPSRAAAIHVVEVPDYVNRLKLSDIGDHIPVADCKWMGGILGKLSAEQIRAPFRAAGYEPAEVEGFAKVVEDRIADLNRL